MNACDSHAEVASQGPVIARGAEIPRSVLPVILSEGQRGRCTSEKKHGAAKSFAIASIDARRRVGQYSPWPSQGYWSLVDVAAAKAVATTATIAPGSILWRPPSRPQIPQSRSTPRRARGYSVSRAFARNVYEVGLRTAIPPMSAFRRELPKACPERPPRPVSLAMLRMTLSSATR